VQFPSFSEAFAVGCYGLQSADNLCNRLGLDLNRAKGVVVQTIGQIQERVVGFPSIFSDTCT
jgi:hypothetical protein